MKKENLPKKRVLILCTGNSARSQLAEALVNHFLGERWQAFSAGTQPAAQVHPLALKALAESQLLPTKKIAEAIELYHLDPEKPDPMKS